MDPAMLPTAASVLPRSEMLTCWRRLKIAPTSTRSSMVPLDGQVVLAWTETQGRSFHGGIYVVGWCACGCSFGGSKVDSSACGVCCLFAFESCCDCSKRHAHWVAEKAWDGNSDQQTAEKPSTCVCPNDSMLVPRFLGGVKLAEILSMFLFLWFDTLVRLHQFWFYDVAVAQGTSQPFLQTGGAMLSASLWLSNSLSSSMWHIPLFTVAIICLPGTYVSSEVWQHRTWDSLKLCNNMQLEHLHVQCRQQHYTQSRTHKVKRRNRLKM